MTDCLENPLHTESLLIGKGFSLADSNYVSLCSRFFRILPFPLFFPFFCAFRYLTGELGPIAPTAVIQKSKPCGQVVCAVNLKTVCAFIFLRSTNWILCRLLTISHIRKLLRHAGACSEPPCNPHHVACACRCCRRLTFAPHGVWPLALAVQRPSQRPCKFFT